MMYTDKVQGLVLIPNKSYPDLLKPSFFDNRAPPSATFIEGTWFSKGEARKILQESMARANWNPQVQKKAMAKMRHGLVLAWDGEPVVEGMDWLMRAVGHRPTKQPPSIQTAIDWHFTARFEGWGTPIFLDAKHQEINEKTLH